MPTISIVGEEKMIPELIGNADKIHAKSGETVAFKISTTAAQYDVAIVRLLRADPSGRGFTEELVAELGEKARSATANIPRILWSS